jgi:hypothetical protein
MYLLYIDDSGTCELKKDSSYSIEGGNTRCFVLGGILIKAHELNRVESEVVKIKGECFKDNMSEIKHSIKGSVLNCGITCNNNIDKTCYKKNIANLLNKIDCTIFATVQDKYYTTKEKIVTNKDDIYRLCFEHLLKSVDTFMYNNKIQEDTIVFIDKKDTGSHKDTLIYKAYKDALTNTKIYRSFSNNIFSPTINVVYSQYTTGAQLADFVAGSVWSFFENSEDKEKQSKCKETTQIYGSKVYTVDEKKIGLSFCKDFLK